MEFIPTLMIVASGLKAQSGRMRVISENIANANSTAAIPIAAASRPSAPPSTASCRQTS